MGISAINPTTKLEINSGTVTLPSDGFKLMMVLKEMEKY